MEENGLAHTFDMGADETRPYDRKLQELSLQPALQPFFSVPAQEQARRLSEAWQDREMLRKQYEEVKSLEMLLKLRRMDTYVKWILKKLGRNK